MSTDLPLCACGCGEPVARKGNRYLSGHHMRTISPEEQARRCKGRIWSDKTRERMRRSMLAFSERQKRNGETQDFNLPLCACGCGLHVRKASNKFVWGHHSRTEAHKQKARETVVFRAGSKHSEETKAKMKAAKKRYFGEGGRPWNGGLTKDLHPSIALCAKNALFQSSADHYDFSFPTTCTRPECSVQIALIQAGIFPFLVNVPIRHICRPDIILPFARIVLQIDGAYWHKGRSDKDASQDAALAAEGWMVFRWTEAQIKEQLPELLSDLRRHFTERSQ